MEHRSSGRDAQGSQLMRSRGWRDGMIPVALAVAAFSSSWALAAAAAIPPVLRFIDDQGKPVQEPLEVCFELGLRSDCLTVAPGEAAKTPDGFVAVRVEGADHGPLKARRSDLQPAADGTLRLVVARKSLLRIGGEPRHETVTLSLYPADDATFRDPVLRRAVAPGERQIRIPAGSFVVALVAAPRAPDLHALVAKPGTPGTVTYSARPGWSLIVRCRAGATGKSVSRAAVDLFDVPGYGRPPRSIGQGSSDGNGLALFSGITATLAGVTVRHPAFLAADGRGIVAGSGTFGLYEAELPQGGRLNATVSLHGRPVASAGCTVETPRPPTLERKSGDYEQLWSGNADARGVCRSVALPPGLYRATVRVPQAASSIFRWVKIQEAQDTEEDVALAPTRVTGTVRRGGEPSPGFEVRTSSRLPDQPAGAIGGYSATATSDDDGKYELTLWTPGTYYFLLRSPAGASAAGHKEITTDGDTEQKLDFDVDSASIAGSVTDEAGAPVPAAWVAVSWQGGIRTTADDLGRFQVDVQGSGSASVTAGKSGYRRSDAQTVQVSEDQPIPPLTLVLKRQVTATGTLLSAAGSPIAGAWVASIGLTEGDPAVFATTRSQGDGTFEVGVPPGPRRIFVSGPGCPLSSFVLAESSDADSAVSDAEDDAAPPPLVCPEAPASLQLTLLDEQGKAIPYASLILRQDGNVVPRQVLAAHLQLLGLPSATDGTGRIVMPYLAPGGYDLYLSSLVSTGMIAAGSHQGYLSAVALTPLDSVELRVTVPGKP
jgi:hypothetical protein